MQISNIARFAIGPLGAAVIGAASIPLLAWLYPPEDIGKIALLVTLSNLSVILFTLGLDQAFIRDYYECSERASLLKAVVSPGLLLLSLSASVALLLFPGWLGLYFFGVHSNILSVAVVICFIAMFGMRYLTVLLRVQGRGLQFSLAQITPKLIFLVFLLFTFIFPSGFDFLLGAHVFSVLATLMLFLFILRKDLISALTASWSPVLWREKLRYGIPLVVSGLATWALMSIDKLLLRSKADFGELGIYSIAVSIAAAVGVLTSVFNTIWAPMVFKWVAEEESVQKIDVVSERLSAVIYFLFVLSGMLSWVVEYFLPKDFVQVKYIVTACMAVPLLYTLSEALGIGLTVSRRTIYAMVAAFLSVLIGLALNYVLIPIYGAAGAAAATACSFWIFVFLRAEFACMVWRNFPRFKIYLSSGLVSGLAAVSAIFGGRLENLILELWIWLGLLGLFIYRAALRSLFCFLDSNLKRHMSSRS